MNHDHLGQTIPTMLARFARLGVPVQISVTVVIDEEVHVIDDVDHAAALLDAIERERSTTPPEGVTL